MTTTTTSSSYTTTTTSSAATTSTSGSCCSGCLCSPNYPSDYDNNLNNEYVMTAPAGQTVTVTFNTFALETATTCNYDSVQIFEGSGTTGTLLLNKTCGTPTTMPGPVTSTSNTATLLLTSDSSVTASGFEAQLNSGVTFSLSSRANRQTNILTNQCWVDCELNHNYVSNPACLLDCFPSNHCLSSLLLDYTGAGGVCGGSYVSKFYPDLWPSSDRSCTFLQHQYSTGEADDDFQIKEGICSKETEALLLDKEKCVDTLYDQAESILVSLQTLIWATCSWDTVRAFKPTPTTTTTTTEQPLDPLQAFGKRKCLFDFQN